MQNSLSETTATSSSSSEDSMTGKHLGDAAPNGPTGAPSTFTNAFGLMKDRATMARNTITPHMMQMKEKTSKKFERYQPSIDRVRSSASAAATIGRERMQPALSKVKVGSTQGWSMFKTKLASAAPVAEKFQTMGLHVVNDFLGETAIEVLFVDNPARANSEFLEQYRHGQPTTYQLMPRMLTNRNRNSSAGKTNDAQLAGVEKCLATPYILGNILLFCGDVQVLARMSLVNGACRSFIRSEKRVWRFCVRYGEMPAHLRFSFWEHAANVNKVRQSSELDFETYLLMAKSKGECTEQILTDVRRTYGRVAPHKRAVGENKEVVVDTEQELINQLSDILHALSGRFPDVGYCQGMDYVAAHVLDHVKKSSEAREAAKLARKAAQQDGDAFVSPPTSPTRSTGQAASRAEVESAFWIMVALFENYGLRQLFCPGLQKLQLHCYQCQRLFELAVPALSEHFENERVMIEMFIVGWFQTLFLYLNVLPRETLDKMWDIFLFENNWKIMLRVALALLQISEPHILNKPIDQVMQFLNTFTTKSDELLAPQELIPKALGIKVTNGMLSKLAKQHTRRKKTGSR